MNGFVYLIGSGFNVGDTDLGMLCIAFSETIGLVGRPSLTGLELKKGTRKVQSCLPTFCFVLSKGISAGCCCAPLTSGSSFLIFSM